jgi:hypothetical protein
METVSSCIPIIPSADIARSKRFWVEGLGFDVESEMQEKERLVLCMLRRGPLAFMLNRRGGAPVAPEGFEGIRLYWAPVNLIETHQRLAKLGFTVTEIVAREYGQTEFFATDHDGYSHCFGVPTP